MGGWEAFFLWVGAHSHLPAWESHLEPPARARVGLGSVVGVSLPSI